MLCLSFFSLSFVYSAGSSSDFTSTGFTVDVCAMSILWCSNDASETAGIWSLLRILGNITDVLLFMIPIIAAVSLMIAGYFYIFSAGDSQKADRAKTIIKWNIVAMLVAFLSYGIVRIVASFFTTI